MEMLGWTEKNKEQYMSFTGEGEGGGVFGVGEGRRGILSCIYIF